jgi:hypothetical protein
MRPCVILGYIIQNTGLLSAQLIDRNHPLHMEPLDIQKSSKP